MHPLTKVLVVLAALLSIALAAFTIAYTANAERLRSDFADARELARAAQEQATRDGSAHATERARLEAQLTDLGNQVSGLQAGLANLQRDNARLLADVKNAEADKLSVQAKIDQLSATNQTLSALISKYRDEVTTLRGNELGYARREIELSDRASDLAGQLEVALENNRSLQEQLVELRDQLAGSARSGAGGVASAGGERIKPTSAIRARVTGVRKDPTGTILVQIDQGSSGLLRPNMELSVVRGQQFLGKLVVQTVDVSESVGRMDYLGRAPVAIEPGDMVLSLVQ